MTDMTDKELRKGLEEAYRSRHKDVDSSLTDGGAATSPSPNVITEMTDEELRKQLGETYRAQQSS